MELILNKVSILSKINQVLVTENINVVKFSNK
jgi:hypothetical protein